MTDRDRVMHHTPDSPMLLIKCISSMIPLYSFRPFSFFPTQCLVLLLLSLCFSHYIKCFFPIWCNGNRTLTVHGKTYADTKNWTNYPSAEYRPHSHIPERSRISRLSSTMNGKLGVSDYLPRKIVTLRSSYQPQ